MTGLRDTGRGPRTTRREVFAAVEVKPGDLIEYPAILRPEHNGVRSRLRVTKVEGRRLLGVDLDHGDDFEWSVEPLQIEENGVVIVRV